MTEAELKSGVCKLVSQKAASFRPFAENFAKQRFLLYGTEFGANAEETEALQQIAAGIRCDITQDDNSVSIDIDFDTGDRGNYLEVVEDGMDAPLTGGHNGIVTNPDGSTRPSRVPEQLWGNPIDAYAKSGSEVLDEVKMMLKDLFSNRIREIVSESKPEIARMAKPLVAQEVHDAISETR